MKKHTLLVLVGPSGSGKTELSKALCKREEFQRLVTATTRPPRADEKDGIDYHFLSEHDFNIKLANREFVEWAYVHGIYRYGTLIAPLQHQLETSKVVVANIDIQGYRSLISCKDDMIRESVLGVFVCTSDFQTLEKRIRKRSKVNEEEVERRLETAQKELLAVRNFSWIVVNDDGMFDEAVAELIRIATL